MMQEKWIIVGLLLIPFYVMFLSMLAYAGKVWAIRILFKRSDIHGEKE